MTNKKILLTGATGFIGKHILKNLPADTHVYGRNSPELPCCFFWGDLSSPSDFTLPLQGVEVVIHSAAITHVKNQCPSIISSEDQYEQINTLPTLSLAEHAAASGVKRFIFISTIKVNGEATIEGKPFQACDRPNPQDLYGLSKAKAEIGLRHIAHKTGMEIVIIRPPLVYGPGVKANFATMLKLASKNLPLPLGAIANKRSLVAVDNLVDLVLRCIEHPNAANQTFLVSDDFDVSTTALLQTMTRCFGKKPWLFPVPAPLLRGVAALVGKKAVIDRLCGNLQVDITHTKKMLDWVPPLTFEQAIKQCAESLNR